MVCLAEWQRVMAEAILPTRILGEGEVKWIFASLVGLDDQSEFVR